MEEFNIGDRVVSIVDHPDNNKTIVVGSIGTVCAIGSSLGVRWDEPVENGHELGGECEYGYGWWVYADQVEIEPDDEPFEFDEEEFNKFLFGV